MFLWHYANTYKDFINGDFTFNINKCDISYMFFYLHVKSFIYKKKTFISDAIINNVICIKYYKYCPYE